MVDHRKPRLAEIMDNIVFTWVDEIPKGKQGRGRHGSTTFKYEALCDLAKSQPEKIICLEQFFDMNMRYLGTNFYKFLKTYKKDEIGHYDCAVRKEGVDEKGNEIYLFYVAYYEELEDDA